MRLLPPFTATNTALRHPRTVDDATLVESAGTLLHVAIAVRADGILTSAEFPALYVQVEECKRALDWWLDTQRALVVVDGAPGMDTLGSESAS